MNNINKKYDVIIVGAGPAGLMAAKVLAKNGREVLVIEKNKIIGPKVCAGGLTPKDFKLGIPKKLASKFFNEIDIYIGDKVLVEKNREPLVSTVDRNILGQWMAGNIKKLGAKILSASNVTEIQSNFIIVNNKKMYFNWLIGADGSNSLVRQYLELPINKRLLALQYIINRSQQKLNKLEIYLDAHLFGSGYAWIFPHAKFTSVGYCADPESIIQEEELRENFD